VNQAVGPVSQSRKGDENPSPAAIARATRPSSKPYGKLALIGIGDCRHSHQRAARRRASANPTMKNGEAMSRLKKSFMSLAEFGSRLRKVREFQACRDFQFTDSQFCAQSAEDALPSPIVVLVSHKYADRRNRREFASRRGMDYPIDGEQKSEACRSLACRIDTFCYVVREKGPNARNMNTCPKIY
jgi:hypothetical protein